MNVDKINGSTSRYSYNTNYRDENTMVIIGWIFMLALLAMDFFVYVAIQLYFEGHPAFNDKAAEEHEKNYIGNRTIGRLQQRDLF